MSDTEFLEYLQIQGSPDMLTKTELVEGVRARGETISDRTLTYYTSQGLIPKAVRVGSRSGAYPKIVQELVAWLVRARKRDVSLETLRELLPLWRHLIKCRTEGRFDLGEIQYLARARVTTTEASAQVPWVLNEVLHGLCRHCVQELVWVLKDGTEHIQSPTAEFSVGFILAELDDQRLVGRPVAWTQLVLPGLAEMPRENPRTIILGIPNNVELDLGDYADDCSHESPAASDRKAAITH